LWSDVAPFLNTAADTAESLESENQDPLVTLLVSIRKMVDVDSLGIHRHNDLRAELEGRALDLHHDGPKTLPRYMMKMLHTDLATAAELDDAVRDPTVFTFHTRKEEARKIVENVSVEIDVAGMRHKDSPDYGYEIHDAEEEDFA